jgi:hypothetical protein
MAAIANLSEYYKSIGKPLPPISERAQLFAKMGLGSQSEYTGTAKQNEALLKALSGSSPPSPKKPPTGGVGPVAGQAGGGSIDKKPKQPDPKSQLASAGLMLFPAGFDPMAPIRNAWNLISQYFSSKNICLPFVNCPFAPAPAPATTPAPAPQVGKTMYGTDWVNVRSIPTTSGNTPIRKLRPGTAVVVISEKDGWSQIGPNEWVSSKYLAPTEPLIRVTSEKVYSKVNNDYNVKIDDMALSEWEGKQYRTPYIPCGEDGKVIGSSGVTIATGVDLGQVLDDYKQRYGLSESLYKKLKPYAELGAMGEMSKEEAYGKMNKLGPLQLTPDEADALDEAALRFHVDSTMTRWKNNKGDPPFENLTSKQQTFLLSRRYNGSSVAENTGYYKSALAGDWDEVERKLTPLSEQDGPLGGRILKELRYLE